MVPALWMMFMSNRLAALETQSGKVYAFLAALVAISIGLIAVLIPLNLLLIKMQWGAISWLHEAIEYAMYSGIFLASPWVLRMGAHVRVDVVLSILPKSAAAVMEKFVDGLGVFICLVLAYYGARATISEFQAGTLPDKDLQIANWIMIAIFTVSFLLLAFEFVFRMGRSAELVNSDDGHAGL